MLWPVNRASCRFAPSGEWDKTETGGQTASTHRDLQGYCFPRLSPSVKPLLAEDPTDPPLLCPWADGYHNSLIQKDGAQQCAFGEQTSYDDVNARFSTISV